MDTSQRYSGYSHGNMNGTAQDTESTHRLTDNQHSFYGHSYPQTTDYQSASNNDANVSVFFCFAAFSFLLSLKAKI